MIQKVSGWACRTYCLNFEFAFVCVRLDREINLSYDVRQTLFLCSVLLQQNWVGLPKCSMSLKANQVNLELFYGQNFLGLGQR